MNNYVIGPQKPEQIQPTEISGTRQGRAQTLPFSTPKISYLFRTPAQQQARHFHPLSVPEHPAASTCHVQMTTAGHWSPGQTMREKCLQCSSVPRSPDLGQLCAHRAQINWRYFYFVHLTQINSCTACFPACRDTGHLGKTNHWGHQQICFETPATNSKQEPMEGKAYRKQIFV